MLGFEPQPLAYEARTIPPWQMSLKAVNVCPTSCNLAVAVN